VCGEGDNSFPTNKCVAYYQNLNNNTSFFLSISQNLLQRMYFPCIREHGPKSTNVPYTLPRFPPPKIYKFLVVTDKMVASGWVWCVRGGGVCVCGGGWRVSGGEWECGERGRV